VEVKETIVLPCLVLLLQLLLLLRMMVCTQAVVGVAGGATRAALTQHQARRNNMADVSAKDGSQVRLFFILTKSSELAIHSSSVPYLFVICHLMQVSECCIFHVVGCFLTTWPCQLSVPGCLICCLYALLHSEMYNYHVRRHRYGGKH